MYEQCQHKGIDGVEFLSLPPVCCYRGGTQLPIRAVLGSERLMPQ